MNKSNLLSTINSDEVLRHWINTRFHAQEMNLSFHYDTKESIAATSHNFIGSVGELDDGRLIKVERISGKDIPEKIAITAEPAHRSSEAGPFNVAMLTTDRVVSGMRELDFGQRGYVESMYVHDLEKQEEKSDIRYKIVLCNNANSDFEASEFYSVSMSLKAFERSMLQIGSPVVLVCKRNTDNETVTVAGMAHLTNELLVHMVNSWSIETPGVTA